MKALKVIITKIIEETGVKIDISDDGIVNVCGTDEAMIDRAIAIITGIVTDIEAGMVFTGKVVRIMANFCWICTVSKQRRYGTHFQTV